ncbi:MAG: hypothetical protein IKK39_05645 [Thermoguttaceae bacterium]|nr:hypothetical protein [Thermoguttaceae bacterium]MBR4103532.1 hypothetical protein [Thermoguttaceae bacterium]
MKKLPVFAVLPILTFPLALGCGDSGRRNIRIVETDSQTLVYVDEQEPEIAPPKAETSVETRRVYVDEKEPEVAPKAETPTPAVLPDFAQLLALGAKIDQSGKSLDLTAVEKLDGFDVAPDAERWNAVKVVRGQGRLTVQTLRALAKLPNLTEFLWSNATLATANSDDATFQGAFADLSKAPRLKKIRLTALRTENGKFPTAALVALAQTPQLADLDVSGASLTAADLAAVDWKNGFAKLTKLNLYQTKIGDAGVDALLPLTDRLTSLNLDDAQIGPDSAAKIAQFTELTFLHVGRSTLDDASIAQFAKLGKLAKIHVTRSKATEAGADALRAALPNCEVVSQPEN